MNPKYKAPDGVGMRGGGPVLRLRGGAGGPSTTTQTVTKTPSITATIYGRNAVRRAVNKDFDTFRTAIWDLIDLATQVWFDEMTESWVREDVSSVILLCFSHNY